MIITISGIAGSGKDTVGKILSQRLGYKFYSMGDLRGEMALKRGLTIQELNKLGEKESWTDKEVDDYQRELGKTQDNFIIIGRTSFHFIPHSIKIFLDVHPKIGAKRILGDNRPDESYTNLEKAMESLKRRKESDHARYMKYYNLDIFDKKHYNLIIDTSEITPQEVADKILDFLKNPKTI